MLVPRDERDDVQGFIGPRTVPQAAEHAHHPEGDRRNQYQPEQAGVTRHQSPEQQGRIEEIAAQGEAAVGYLQPLYRQGPSPEGPG